MMSGPFPEQLDRPIVVIGSPRSGTSLLGKLLGEHPALAQRGLDVRVLTSARGYNDSSAKYPPR